METIAAKLQKSLNQFQNAGLKIDGIYGALTSQEAQKCAEFFGLEDLVVTDTFLDFLNQSSMNHSKNQDIRQMTAINGARVPEKISTFGGPYDKGDRTNGLAFVSTYQAETPRAIAEAWIARDYQHRNLFRLRDMMQDERWPRIEGDAMGLSYYLDVETNYAAMRIPSGTVTAAQRDIVGILVNIYSVKTDTWVYSPVIDYGPAQWTGRAIDVSPGLLLKLGLKTDDVVCIAWSR